MLLGEVHTETYTQKIFTAALPITAKVGSIPDVPLVGELIDKPW